MRQNINKSLVALGAAKIILCLAAVPTVSAAVPEPLLQQKDPSAIVHTPAEKQTVKAFEKHVKRYVKLREELELKLPALSKEARPEEIEAHKKAFEGMVRQARANARPGEVFTSDIAGYIRTLIKTEFTKPSSKERIESSCGKRFSNRIQRESRCESITHIRRPKSWHRRRPRCC